MRRFGGLLLLEDLGRVVGDFPVTVETTEILFGCMSEARPELATVHGEQRKKEVVSQREECGQGIFFEVACVGLLVGYCSQFLFICRMFWKVTDGEQSF